MFGTTMSAADLTLDGLDELLVGAPAQSEDECVECGALHIYIGGDVVSTKKKTVLRLQLILFEKLTNVVRTACQLRKNTPLS